MGRDTTMQCLRTQLQHSQCNLTLVRAAHPTQACTASWPGERFSSFFQSVQLKRVCRLSWQLATCPGHIKHPGSCCSSQLCLLDSGTRRLPLPGAANLIFGDVACLQLRRSTT